VNTAGTLNYYVTQTSPANCTSSPTIITVTIQPQISGNTIGNDVTLCQGSPSPAINPAATISGGNNNYTYSWESSTDGVTWTAISGTGSSITPGTFSTTTMFRRTVNSGTCSNISNTVTIYIQSPISNTAIDGDHTICEGSTPPLLTGPGAGGGSGTFNYQWETSTDNNNWINAPGASTNKDYQPPVLTSTTWYRRKVSGGSCSAVSASVKITVNPLPNGSISAVSTICEYDVAAVSFTASAGVGPFTVDLQITGPGGTSTVTQSVPNNNPYAINVLAAGSTPGTYSVTLTSIRDNINCPRTTAFTPVTITVNPKPSVTVNPPASFCQGTPGTPLVASGATNYSWSPATGLSSTTGSNIMASPSSTTTYTVTGTTNGCNSDPRQVTVNVDPKPAKPMVLTPVSYCQYDPNPASLVAAADGSDTLKWYLTYPSAGQLNAPVPSTGNNGTVNYYVTQTSPPGCTSDTATITVSVHPAPSVTFTMPDAICMSTDGSGTAAFNSTSSVSDNSLLNYTWSFGDGTYGTGKSPVHFYQLTRPYADQQIVLTAISAFNCAASDTNILAATVFHDKPVALFTTSDSIFCQGKTSIFSDSSSGATGIKSWSWNFGDVTYSSLRNPAKYYTRPGNYLVQLVVKDSANCTSDIKSKNIIVYLQPVVDAGQSYYVLQGTTIHFNPHVNDSIQVSFNWTPSIDFANPNMLRPSLIVMHDETYRLTATGAGGCTASDTMNVYVLQPVSIPNAFSPNGDGINDKWDIPNLLRYPGCSVEVFNRYGQKVFSSAGYATPWDGRYNGQPLPVATYYYVIILKNGFQPISGSITIIK
jgi:gliding motility-associated-like protein